MIAWFSKVRDMFRDRPWGTALLLLLVGYGSTLLFDAWLSDDAYITFRVVDNVIHGFGPVYNVGERVQAYTNPLMMLVMSAFASVTREVYFTAIFVSIAASFSAVAVLALKVARSRITAVAALVVLVFSTSFVSYSTSGLENCLIFLLAALFFWAFFAAEKYSARSLLILTLLFALSLVNRMDTALLLAPALAFAYVRNDAVPWSRMLGALVAGMLPFIAWEAFAVAYYGFPFPNTAYAKLSTGIPKSEYLVRAFAYYKMSFWQDPMVLAGIIAGAGAILWARRARTSVPLVGVLLYLVYIVNIGGDFMRGQDVHRTAVRDDAAASWRSLPRSGPHGASNLASLVIGALGLLLVANLGGLFYEGMSWNTHNPYGVLDDKRLYYQATNLPLNLYLRPLETVAACPGGSCSTARPATRRWSIRASDCAATTPAPRFTSSTRLRSATRYWRGFRHWTIRRGASATCGATSRTAISTRSEPVATRSRIPGVAEYYDHLATVIKGPLWTAERWREILALNRGDYDDLIDRDYYRSEARAAVRFRHVRTDTLDGQSHPADTIQTHRPHGTEE